MKPKIENDVYLSVVMDVFWQKGGRTKTTRTKSPRENLRELRQIPWKDICLYACTTKNGGVRDVWRALGGPKMCDKVWQGLGRQKCTLWTAP